MLSACIECQSSNVRIRRMVEVKGERYQIVCDNCGASTSGHRREEGAAAIWNHFAKIHASAYRAGIEAAAKVAESYVVGKPSHVRQDHAKPRTQSMTRIGIAAAIRALAEKTENVG